MKTTRLPLLVAVAGLLIVGWVGLRVVARAPDTSPDIDPHLPYNITALKDFQSMQVDAFNSSEGFGDFRMGAPTMNMGAILSVPLQLRNSTKARFARTQFELVSLLKHTPPVVYAFTTDLSATHMALVLGTKHRPATAIELNLMGVAKPPPPTRPLDAFEVAALKRLQAGVEVVAGVDHGQMRVLGAVRARESCVKCHEGTSVGTLLGAFTYSLVPSHSG